MRVYMLQPTSPPEGSSRERARRLSLAVLLAIPSAGAICLELVRRGLFTPVAAIGCVALTAMAAGLCSLIFAFRRVEERDQGLENVEADRKRVLAEFENKTGALQREIAERAKELESANASLRVATKVNALLALCAQHMPSGVIITDAKGLILWANQSWESLSGWSEPDSARQPVDELLGRVWNGFAPSEGRRIVEQGEAGTLETRASRPDGSVRWLTIAFQPVRNAAQQVVNFIVIVDDVTAQREADLRLKTANDRLQLALRSSGNGIWETRMDSGQLDWDDRMHEIYGVSRADFHGTLEDWYRLIHPEDLEALQAHRQQVLEGTAQNFDIDFRIIRPNGEIRHMEAHGALLRDSAGTPQRFVGLNRDITAEKQMRETLRVAEERLALALLATNEGVWDWNVATGHIYHDSRVAELLGEDPAEVESTIASWKARVHPDDQAAAQAALDAHMQNRAAFYISEHRLRTKAGGWIWTLDRGRVVSRDKDGKPLRMVGTQGDITARKKLEERLRHSDEISIQVSRLAQIGAWELRAADLELSWEPELFRIAEAELGYAPTLQKMAEFFVGIDQDMFLQAVRQAIQDGHSFDMECPFTTALGRRRTVHVFGRAEFKEGRAVRIFGAVQDITARHEAEEAQRKLESQLFQVQKMETLGTLAGGIAHDFNNLLTGIMGYNDLALDGLAEDHPARACLNESRSACMRACQLVEQILVFSRQTTGTERVPVDVAFIVEEARRFLRATVPATIQIEVNMAQNCGRVLADATQLNQVLLNLGSNAAHAMRTGPGLMKITVERSELNSTQAAVHGNLPAGAYLRLSVSDTGHGMDAETQARIFDPFFTTKQVGEGTGLGLAIVHGIVRAHGGAIEVESAIGVGTTFHIYLPAAKGESDRTETAPAAPKRGAGEIICIVDDEQLVADATRLSLERFGYQPTVFNSSDECLKALRQEPGGCALLLSDQTMPGMTGMELSTEVRKFAPNLPIVIMSGYFSKVSAGALEQIGRISLLAKPFTTTELTQAVHRALHPDET
jgi:PAS domain S-box-containing protein